MEAITLLIIGGLFVYLGYDINAKKLNNKEKAKGFKEALWMKLSGVLFAIGMSMLAFFIVLLIEPIDFSIMIVAGNDIRFKSIFVVWAYAFFFVAIVGLFFNLNITKSVLNFHKKFFNHF